MATTTINTATDALREMIARGVAAYQNSLPDFARDDAPATALPYHARPACELPEPQPVITLDEEVQMQLCLRCELDECIDITDDRCPIRIEQRRVWRESRRR